MDSFFQEILRRDYSERLFEEIISRDSFDRSFQEILPRPFLKDSFERFLCSRDFFCTAIRNKNALKPIVYVLTTSAATAELGARSMGNSSLMMSELLMKNEKTTPRLVFDQREITLGNQHISTC